MREHDIESYVRLADVLDIPICYQKSPRVVSTHAANWIRRKGSSEMCGATLSFERVGGVGPWQ